MFVTCPRCSQQNYDTASQCAYCGTPLAAPPPPAPTFGNTNAPGFAGTTGAGAGRTSDGGAAQPQIGQIIDRKYRVERVLGEGGMGVVYVATDINADQKVVIKSILPQFANRGDFRERTLAEGKALAKIDHQNVVRFNSIVSSPETNELYIVMQFIEGESLDRTLERNNAAGQKIPIPEVIRLFKQILDGVGAAHKEGLMHRDLKPANVLVRAKDGVAKVMDFGIAKAEGSTKGPTQAGGIVGSLYYMAPEQIKGARDLDKRLDVYALGVVLYELTTGVVPFDGETEFEIMTKHMQDPLPSVLQRRPDAPAWFDQVIAKATQKERTARFQSCEEFRAAIDALDGGIAVPRSMTALENPAAPARTGTAEMSPMVPGTSSGSFPGPAPSAPKKSGGSGALIAVVAVLVIGGGGAGWYFTAGPGGDAAKADKAAATDGKSKAKDKEKDKPKEDPKGSEKVGDAVDNMGKHKPKKSPLDALVGSWKAEGSGREFNAVRVGDEVEFRVAKPEQFDGIYQKDETRFRLGATGDQSTFNVIDRVRPAPKGAKYSVNALSTCTKEFTSVKGHLLEATLKSEGNIEVNFAKVNTNNAAVVFEAGTITNCNAGLFDVDKAESVVVRLRKE